MVQHTFSFAKTVFLKKKVAFSYYDFVQKVLWSVYYSQFYLCLSRNSENDALWKLRHGFKPVGGDTALIISSQTCHKSPMRPSVRYVFHKPECGENLYIGAPREQ